MKYTRREFGKAALTHLPAAALASRLLTSHGLYAFAGKSGDTLSHRIGTISYSFKELKKTVGEAQWPEVLERCHECGLSYLEIEIGKVEPIFTLISGYRPSAVPQENAATGTPYGTACVAPSRSPATPTALSPADRAAQSAALTKAREDARRFREDPPPHYYTDIRRRAADLGISINAYTCGWGADYTDREIDAVFTAARELGAHAINSSSSLEMARRLALFANKHQFPVAFHEHLFGLFSNADDYADTLQLSKYFRINFDIGHFTSSCGNAVVFIEHFHDKISSIHVKDYKSSNGGSMPWGEGDSPIKPAMQLLRKIGFPGVTTIELDYPIPAGSNSVTEIKRCAQYLRNTLT
ncbi:sugar phosphate isomerase/epimerase [Terriglobus albidus]|uniref:Sugar phosphate isomerase/epimerase n=1 Tax=Terriglobus albidus TaxID=1592106 RepID=A0A5B9EB72_9BACT|nr:TIM barrel protein [Terriglobus albidus]QEE28944.1 sugar phosphate isomerase/epimerase [Terriglobus albidus]